MTVIIFLIVLAILIFVHELGHFIFARACGIRVDAFAIGFGPKIFSKKVGETVYLLNLIPFGGYVKIFGENPDDESINGEDKDRSFIHKDKIQQVLVLFAGILFNLIFAWLLITITFSIGVLSSMDSYTEYKDMMKDPKIIITFVSPDSPADKAGLKAGDQLITSSLSDIQENINESKDQGIEIKYRRGMEEFNTNVIAEKGILENKYAIGIAMDNVAVLKLPFDKSIIESFRFTWHIMVTTAIGLYSLILGIFSGNADLTSVTGPIGIAGLVGDAVKLGFSYLIMFTAVISINLGILNLIPFPALDGGRILFVIIEAIIRKPIKPIIANTINAIGFGLLILLMIVVTYKDIIRIFIK